MTDMNSTWFLIHAELGQRKLDFYALRNSFSVRVNPVENLMLRRMLGSAKDLLDDTPTRGGSALSGVHAPPIRVTPEATPFKYKAEGGEEYDFAEHEECEYGEFDYRHPGTHWDSDDEDERCQNEIFAPISTKAGQELGSILFCGAAGSPTCELKAAYKMQLSVRIDVKRLALVYDAFEYKGPAMEPSDELPTKRSIHSFLSATHVLEPRRMSFGFGFGPGGGDGDANGDGDDDPTLDQAFEPKGELDGLGRMALHLQGHSGDFMASRVLRLRVPLASVCGARLHAPGEFDESTMPDAESRALLVLEFDSPPPEDAFAARKLGSTYRGEREFSSVPDWTPQKAASSATRHYISGGFAELRRLAAHLAHVSTKMRGMLGVEESTAPPVANTLAPPASLALADTPPFRGVGVDAGGIGGDEMMNAGGLPSLQALSASAAVGAGASAAVADDAGYPPAVVAAISAAAKAKAHASLAACLTREGVHELMQQRLGLSAEEAAGANPCFKQGVLRGHLKIGERTTLKTVICFDDCICCGAARTCTIGMAIKQPACGGLDYEDGGQLGAVQCEDCCGMYVTGLCQGRPRFESGKFHNHCTACPEFGTCIGDYRNEHCTDCGKHWFAGMSGFSCSHCGGGNGWGRKAKSQSELPPPPPAAFDGVIDGAVSKVRARMPQLDPLQRIVLGSLLAYFDDDTAAARRGARAGGMDPVALMHMMAMGARGGGGGDGDSDSDGDGDSDGEGVPPEAASRLMALMAMMAAEEEEEEEEAPKRKRGKNRKAAGGGRVGKGSSSSSRSKRGGAGTSGGAEGACYSY